MTRVQDKTLRDRACAVAQMRIIWHCKLCDTTPAVAEPQVWCSVMSVTVFCLSPCPCSKKKTAWAINTKLGSHMSLGMHWSWGQRSHDLCSSMGMHVNRFSSLYCDRRNKGKVHPNHSRRASQWSWSRCMIPNKYGYCQDCGCWLQQNDVTPPAACLRPCSLGKIC